MYPQHLWLPIFVPKQAYHGAGKMSQMLRALAILQDNADLTPSTHIVLPVQFQGMEHPLLSSRDTEHM